MEKLHERKIKDSYIITNGKCPFKFLWIEEVQH